ncbi:hypothetical protein FGU71_13215 [Erythrobacter insulae]|uniref:Peptidase inhibitor I78 n=1 Tax=Erythrobacter insulae TaxID=2584124 RepID=A0A547P747_9SPHN|nr:hypothetical protein [Erythrobacter insulae]TRD09959.1 hypothetical protein FGU71_13215 [Erythrobacter insulae]
MTSFRAIAAATILLALSACGSDPDSADEARNAADDFAARINGVGDGANNNPPTTGNAPRSVATPTIAEPLQPQAQAAFTPGTANDPASETCGANKMGPFIGMVADVRTRVDIEDVAGPGREIRFLRPGGAFVQPDASNPRLNVMLDSQDIIRDARCG